MTTLDCPSRPGLRRPQPHTRLSIAEAVSRYLLCLQASGRSPATLATYFDTLRRLISLLYGVPLDAVTSHALAGVLAALTFGCSGRPCAETTMNRHRSALRAFFRWAFESGSIPHNPAALVRLARVQSPARLCISREETARLLDTIRASPDPLGARDAALFAVCAMAGLRRSEALWIRIADFDPLRRILRVFHAKGRRPRAVPVAAALACLLDDLRHSPLHSSSSPAAFLFPGRSPRAPLSPRQADARFVFWRNAAGLRSGLTIHSLRAGFATALHEETSDLLLVSRALGHRDLRPTLRYLDPSMPRLRSAIAAAFCHFL
jgi:integrase/recombinase XerC